MTSHIDTCGLSCPQPVLLFLTALRKTEAKEFDVLVDNEVSRENVTRAAENHGCHVTAHQEGNDVTRLHIAKN